MQEGQLAFRRNELEVAEAHFRHALTIDPDNHPVQQMLGLVVMSAQSASVTRAKRPGGNNKLASAAIKDAATKKAEVLHVPCSSLRA
eukprot:SAG22_NODE_1342_length_4685_cov_3.468818_2_plen_87_part_00